MKRASSRLGRAALCLLVAHACVARAQGEPYRPQFHFTPQAGWMNDPNGLVYFAGQWHLFFQHNPFGDKWGHMSWGHAVSGDLVHWRELPVALPEADSVMIFSGSAVVDWNNSSGLGKNGQPPLVAIYTGHHPPIQDQRIAFSTDSGRTWTKVPGAVLDLHMSDFRDPKVFWHAASNSWVMAVALPNEHRVSIYRSPDLTHWTHASDFGPMGATGGQWECPDLFELPVAGTAERRWVMIVNINPGGYTHGSGTQYFTGSFDGTRFVADSDSRATRWADYGPDFYAAVTWNDVPASDGRRILLAWMNNWSYGQDIPTSPWRSAMSVPRELSLVRTRAGLRLAQQPVRELASLRDGAPRVFSGGSWSAASRWLEAQGSLPPLLDVTLEFANVDTTTVSLAIQFDAQHDATVFADPRFHRLGVSRERSGLTQFNGWFPGTYTAPLDVPAGGLTLRVLLDESSIETFAQDGTVSMTTQVFPVGGERRLRLGGVTDPRPRVRRIVIQPLRSAWSR